ncbi:MAG: hypothetical protein KME31_37140 [Tolypothrix carrinoi HA7290-LM1]|jgi:hypothetical protein|nr:hypothetical protein [Tolypothrix carrinoi HA7290-LM1]
MNNITLLNSTKVPKVDLLLCEIINLLEQSFSNRIRGYYLQGSYANHSAVATSDKAYLLTELQHTDDAYKLYTVKRLGQIVYGDRNYAGASPSRRSYSFGKDEKH